ncbi:hypothetical protein V3G39_11685 [Dermatophilaceae bacterium Sec6.4]
MTAPPSAAHHGRSGQSHAQQHGATAGVLAAADNADDKYMNQQLTSAEVIAVLIAMSKGISIEADRG